ncbi:DUF3489 domain-containing protein, partial [Boseongicola aestuarii]
TVCPVFRACLSGRPRIIRSPTQETDMSNTKPQSKRAQLAKMIKRKSGATVETLQDHLGWQPHTIRAEISRLRRTGLVVTCTAAARGSVYKAQVHAMAGVDA